MKKLLLTVAAAALFVPTLAHAQEDQGIKLEIGGYFKGYITYLDQDDGTGGEARKVDIIRDTEPNISGEVTLDNGMTVGAYIAADADRGGNFDVFDSYVYFSGDWGRVNLGSWDSAAYILQVAIPSADPNFDGMDPFVSPFNYDVSGVTQLATIRDDGIDYDQDLTSSNDKITYITPKFGGFQAGLSYTPDLQTTSRSFGNTLDDEAGDFGDIIEVGLRYDGEFDGGKFSLGTGYTNEQLERANASFGDDRQAWNVGADIDIGAFGVGAVYTQDNFGDRNATNSDVTQIGVGVDYTIGAYTLGASYFDQNNEFGANEIDTNRYAAGVGYTFGPGMVFRGTVTHIEHDVDAALGADFDGTAVLIGTDITF